MGFGSYCSARKPRTQNICQRDVKTKRNRTVAQFRAVFFFLTTNKFQVEISTKAPLRPLLTPVRSQSISSCVHSGSGGRFFSIRASGTLTQETQLTINLRWEFPAFYATQDAEKLLYGSHMVLCHRKTLLFLSSDTGNWFEFGWSTRNTIRVRTTMFQRGSFFLSSDANTCS